MKTLSSMVIYPTTQTGMKKGDTSEDKLVSSWRKLVKHEVLSDIIFNIDVNSSDFFINSNELTNTFKESKNRVKKEVRTLD